MTEHRCPEPSRATHSGSIKFTLFPNAIKLLSHSMALLNSRFILHGNVKATSALFVSLIFHIFVIKLHVARQKPL